MSEKAEPPGDLQELQEWFQSAITTPWAANMQALSEVVHDGEGELSPSEQLGIYTRSYQGRLIECMESEYPVLHLALGKDLFVRFASEDPIATPSRSYTLTTLGAEFPAYLRETCPDFEDELWPRFIIELALLERLFSEVYHGEGVEDHDTPTSDDTAEIAQESNTRFLECAFPLDDFFIATRQHLKDPSTPAPEFPEPEPVHLMIFRRNYIVQLRRITLKPNTDAS